MHQFLLYSCYIELLMQVRLFKFASHAVAKLKFYLIPHFRVILFYDNAPCPRTKIAKMTSRETSTMEYALVESPQFAFFLQAQKS